MSTHRTIHNRNGGFMFPRRTVLAMAGLTVGVTLVGPSGGVASGSRARATGGKTYTLRIGTAGPTNTTIYAGMQRFARLVQKNTGGKVKVQLFPNGELGDEATMVSNIENGTLSGAVISTGTLSSLVPTLNVVSLPYAFISSSAEFKQLNGRLGRFFDGKFKTHGVTMVGWMTAGPRDVLAKSPVTSLADLKHLAIRTIPTPEFVDAWKAIGAAPDPVGTTEMFAALSSGVVTAIELAPEYLLGTKVYEVAKDLTECAYVTTANGFILNSKTLASLPPKYLTIVENAAKTASNAQVRADNVAEKSALKQLVANGVHVYRIDKAEWAAAWKPFDRYYAHKLGALKIYKKIVLNSNS